ncbi:MAG: hypothetical protein SGCHY_003753, partial [Lobulomycetales sp.]
MQGSADPGFDEMRGVLAGFTRLQEQLLGAMTDDEAADALLAGKLQAFEERIQAAEMWAMAQ